MKPYQFSQWENSVISKCLSANGHGKLSASRREKDENTALVPAAREAQGVVTQPVGTGTGLEHSAHTRRDVETLWNRSTAHLSVITGILVKGRFYPLLHTQGLYLVQNTVFKETK